MEAEYNLVAQDSRKDSEQCADCRNRLPDGECAVELAVVSGGAIFNVALNYQEICDQQEIENER